MKAVALGAVVVALSATHSPAQSLCAGMKDVLSIFGTRDLGKLKGRLLPGMSECSLIEQGIQAFYRCSQTLPSRSAVTTRAKEIETAIKQCFPKATANRASSTLTNYYLGAGDPSVVIFVSSHFDEFGKTTYKVETAMQGVWKRR